jgi:hypothetical protein
MKRSACKSIDLSLILTLSAAALAWRILRTMLASSGPGQLDRGINEASFTQ